MGDFWGLEKALPDFADNLGVSAALVHSEKGAKLFGEARSRMEVIPCSVQNCLQPPLRHPTQVSRRREAFWRDFNRGGIELVYRHYVIPALVRQKVKLSLVHPLVAALRTVEPLARLEKKIRQK